MRIAIDARELSGRPTGVGRYLQHLLHEWARGGLPHTFTLYSHDGRLAIPPGLAAEVALVPGSGGTAWEQGALARAVRRDRPGVFFAPGYTGPLRCGCPSVIAIHDVSFAAHPEWFRWREGARRRWLARLSARRAHTVLTISTFSRDEIVRHLGVPAARVRVIPLGVGIDVPGRDPAAAEPLVLYVGSIFNRRHLPELIAGFGQLASRRADVHLEIVGENRTWPAQDLAADAARTGAGDRIRVRDWVSDMELAGLYRRASAFAFLSEYEGFGLTPLEALAAGIPPVVLDTPVAREVYGPAAIYVATPGPAAIARALAEALDRGRARDEVLRAAPDVLARYRWRDTAEATLAALVEAGPR
jgi:glycosyltransferase involved in cell wall biosynthesis